MRGALATVTATFVPDADPVPDPESFPGRRSAKWGGVFAPQYVVATGAVAETACGYGPGVVP